MGGLWKPLPGGKSIPVMVAMMLACQALHAGVLALVYNWALGGAWDVTHSRGDCGVCSGNGLEFNFADGELTWGPATGAAALRYKGVAPMKNPVLGTMGAHPDPCQTNPPPLWFGDYQNSPNTENCKGGTWQGTVGIPVCAAGPMPGTTESIVAASCDGDNWHVKDNDGKTCDPRADDLHKCWSKQLVHDEWYRFGMSGAGKNNAGLNVADNGCIPCPCPPLTRERQLLNVQYILQYILGPMFLIQYVFFLFKSLSRGFTRDRPDLPQGADHQSAPFADLSRKLDRVQTQSFEQTLMTLGTVLAMCSVNLAGHPIAFVGAWAIVFMIFRPVYAIGYVKTNDGAGRWPGLIAGGYWSNLSALLYVLFEMYSNTHHSGEHAFACAGKEYIAIAMYILVPLVMVGAHVYLMKLEPKVPVYVSETGTMQQGTAITTYPVQDYGATQPVTHPVVHGH